MDAIIYFITDLHFRVGQEVPDDLINSISEFMNNDFEKKKILLIGGDLSYSGKSEEYITLEKFIASLREKVSEDFEIVCCPGNHDISYNDKEVFRIEDLPHPKNQKEEVNNIKERLKKIVSYHTFQNRFTHLEKVDDILYKITIQCKDKNLIIYSLNNILFTLFGDGHESSDTRGYVSLPNSTIKKIKRENNNDIVILLMHYPYSYFDETTEKDIQNNWVSNINIICNGHLHALNEKNIHTYGRDINIIQGKAFYEKSTPNNSSFIKIDLSKNKSQEFYWNSLEESFVNDGEHNDLIISFLNKNTEGLVLSSSFIKQKTSLKLCEQEFNLDDIFVFPILEEKRYKELGDDHSEIRCFENFLSKLENNKFLFIQGDEKTGKTTLAEYLTLELFKNNYVPILCDGNEIDKAPIESIIRSKIDLMYENVNAAKTKFENTVNFQKKVIIIDDYMYPQKEKLNELSENFSKIIVFTSNRLDKEFKEKVTIKEKEILHYAIQPLVKSKRKEFCENIYSALKNKGEKALVTKDKFSNTVERILSNFSQKEMYDPMSLAHIILYSYRNNASFNNKFFSTVYQAKSLLMLDEINRKKQYNYDLDVVQRIISSLAYHMYTSLEENIVSEQLDKIIKHDVSVFGDYGIKEKNFLDLCTFSLILKTNDDGKITFLNRDVFAYFVAYNIGINKRIKDRRQLKKLVKKSVFNPLNFGVLMCLSSIQKDPWISSLVIKSIYSQFKHQKLLDTRNFSVNGLTQDQKMKLSKLQQNEIKKMREEEDKEESNQRKHYLKNKESLYYEDKLSPRLKDICEWHNRLKVCCVLLKSFGSNIDITLKEKLIKLIIDIPDVILYKFNNYFFKELDKIYALLCESVTDTVEVRKKLEELNTMIVSTKRAFVLSTYDYGTRSFTDKSSISLLKDEIDKNNKTPLKLIQGLMLSSFSEDENAFIERCSNIISSKEYSDVSFEKTSAKLIGRRFLIENANPDEDFNKYKKFENIIYDNQKSKIKDKLEKLKNNQAKKIQ